MQEGKKKRRNFLTTEKVVEQFLDKHGKTYGYELVEYVSNQIKVKIVCRQHGIFEQTPDHHKKGSGCPKCANLSRSESMLKRFNKSYSTSDRADNDLKKSVESNDYLAPRVNDFKTVKEYLAAKENFMKSQENKSE
jgi:hypothetical protein